MTPYKVELTFTRTYTLDILTGTEEKAKEEALKVFDKLQKANIEHYHETQEPVVICSNVYDVSNTDDADYLQPLN